MFSAMPLDNIMDHTDAEAACTDIFCVPRIKVNIIFHTI